MATSYQITNKYRGEGLSVRFFAKDAQGAAIADAEAVTVFFTVSSKEGGDPLLTFSTANITLTDALTAEWFINLTAADLSVLKENTQYYYNIWTQAPGEELNLSAKGGLKLLPSIEPAI